MTGGYSTGGDGPAPVEFLCHLNLQEEVVGQRLGGQLVIQVQGPNPGLLLLLLRL